MEVLGALFLSSDERERERNPIVENPLARERERERKKSAINPFVGSQLFRVRVRVRVWRALPPGVVVVVVVVVPVSSPLLLP
jgi:hypothetical protein